MGKGIKIGIGHEFNYVSLMTLYQASAGTMVLLLQWMLWEMPRGLRPPLHSSSPCLARDRAEAVKHLVSAQLPFL